MGNNFAGDTNCKALWKFENGALTSDSKGTNTLTNNNGVIADTVNYKEGLASADFEDTSSQYFSITDANLNAGFPLKSGDVNKIISICCWFRLESAPADLSYRSLFSKYDTTNTKRTIQLRVYRRDSDSTRRLELIIGYNAGASGENFAHATFLSLATWYHVTATFKDSDKSYSLRLKDVNGDLVGSDVTGTAVNNINVEDAAVQIGSSNPPTPTWFMDGLIDELVVFDDIIIVEESTQIAKGLYGLSAFSTYLGGDGLCHKTLGARVLS